MAAGAVVLGPRVTVDDVWIEPELAVDVDLYLDSVEDAITGLRAEAAKEIVWTDPDTRRRAPVAMVYLHGFSADRHELEPVISDAARDLGANVYFARLRGHGRVPSAMAEATVEDWLADAAEAVAIGARIGERVVVLGTSTGGTLAIWAAGRSETEDRIAALVLISPNLQPRDRSSRILLQPWGSWIARAVVGRERCFEPENDAQALHWTTCYPTSALTPMMGLVEHVRTSDPGAIDVPTLLVYSPDDEVVDATETEAFMNRLPDSLLHVHVVEGSSDPSDHVLAGDVLSPNTNAEVRDAIVDFVNRILAAPDEAGSPR